MFIDGLNTNIALLRYKDYQLTDTITGMKFKIKASNIDDAKRKSIDILKDYWKKINIETKKIINLTNI